MLEDSRTRIAPSRRVSDGLRYAPDRAGAGTTKDGSSHLFSRYRRLYSTTSKCKYAPVVSRLVCPVACCTSANAQLMKVWRPWWIVSARSRSSPSTRQAGRNRRRIACRRNGVEGRLVAGKRTKESPGLARWPRRSAHQASRSASVPASQQAERFAHVCPWRFQGESAGAGAGFRR